MRKLSAMLCRLVEQGLASKREFDLDYEEHCRAGGKRTEEPESAAEALAVAEEALSANNELLNADAVALSRFLVFFNLVALIGRLILRYAGPVGKLVAVGTAVVQDLARGRLEQVAVQKAANDQALAIVRRAAANAERFRIRAGGG